MRTPLTKKRKAAILTYVIIRAEKHGQFVYNLVEDTLKAERKNADDLYSYLERRGHRWNGVYWTKKS